MPSDEAQAKMHDKGPANENSATLIGSNIRGAINGYFDGKMRKVLEVKITRVEEGSVSGFLRVRIEAEQENFLMDFQATTTPQGTVSSLEIDGKDVSGSLSRGDLHLN